MFYDWLTYFWPQLQNPWIVQYGVFNLPWLFVLLQPLRLLGPYGSVIALEFMAVLVIIKLGKMLRLSLIHLLMVIFSPPVLWNLFMGQIDGIMLMAYLLSSYFAVGFMLSKPQSNLGAGVYAIYKQPFSLLVIVFLLGTAWAIWGWPFSITGKEAMGPLFQFNVNKWNWSYWPLGIIAIPMLFAKDKRYRMFVSPFLFPYAAVQSLIAPLLAVATLPIWVFLPVWCMMWARWFYMMNYL
ncbi:MAG: hypothetical protein DRI56_00970 [Chloroflexota bacterium]|nr:MAG: hypothetical protein DRI56_00970 [Chloroflexota bacterium]